MRRLIVRPGAIGDFIVSLPAMECLRTAYTEVWTRSELVPLVHFADRVRAISSTGLDLLGVVEPPPATLVAELSRFDSIISWYGANRPDFQARTCQLGLPIHFFRALPPEGTGIHATDFYLSQVRTLTECAGDGIPRLPFVAERLPFAVIHPFSGSRKKNWPLENFRVLAGRLESHLRVEWCAGPEEELAGARRFERLDDLARWLASASLYVGNDSGITHLAAAVGTPVLALFGPTDPAVWAPRGPHVRIGRW